MRVLHGTAAWVGLSALGCAAIALGACFSSSSGGASGGPSFDSGTFDGATFDTSMPDGPSTAETGSEGGSPCPLLDLSTAPFVNTVINTDAQAPVMTGGAIVPGTYVQTTITAYDPANSQVTGESPTQSVIQFGATSYHSDGRVWFSYDASPDSPPSAEQVIVGDYAIDGSAITITETCNLLRPDASGLTGTGTYTATPTSYATSHAVGDSGIIEVVTFTKQ